MHREGKDRHIALDVVEWESRDASDTLNKYSNVIIIPHIATYTYEALQGMDEAIENYLLNKLIDGLVVTLKNLESFL